jgi:uncharacterized protein YcnI
MRCSGWSSLAISVCRGEARLALGTASALVVLTLASTATAHVFPMPQFLPSQGTESVILDVPNEREEPMTGFVVEVPDGLEIAHAHPAVGWDEEFDASSARWTGGPLAALTTTQFGISLKAATEPGDVVLETELLYDSGAVVRWPVAMTVTPAEKSASQNLALAAVVGLIGLLVVGAVAMLAWRRRTEPLQEK